MGDNKEIKPADRQEVKHFALGDALTEVMRRRVAAEPQLPADFSQRIADAMMARRRKARLRTIVGWSTLGAVAACLLIAFFLLQKPANPANKQIANIPTVVPSTPILSDTTVFEPLYKQTAQFSTENLISPHKGFPHRGGTGGGSVSLYHPHQHTSM